MSSITDDAISGMPQKAESVSRLLQESKMVADSLFEKGDKGLCLMWRGAKFTLETVMRLCAKYLGIGGDPIKYEHNNIRISQLQEAGNLETIDTEVTAAVMQYFIKAAKDMKVDLKYAAVVDKSADPPTYRLFFEGKNLAVIKACMSRATAAWEKGEKGGREEKSKTSLREKLRFFREKAQKMNRNRERTKDRERNKRRERAR